MVAKPFTPYETNLLYLIVHNYFPPPCLQQSFPTHDGKGASGYLFATNILILEPTLNHFLYRVIQPERELLHRNKT